MIFSVDEDVAFEADFVPALRHFATLILEGKYDIIGGCIRTTATDCLSYTYIFPEADKNRQTLEIKSVDLSSAANIIKSDAVDNLFLATKAALQFIRFDPHIVSGESIDFFLRSLTILGIGGSSMRSKFRNVKLVYMNLPHRILLQLCFTSGR